MPLVTVCAWLRSMTVVADRCCAIANSTVDSLDVPRSNASFAIGPSRTSHLGSSRRLFADLYVFRCQLTVEADDGPLHLDIKGPPGTTDFLSALLEERNQWSPPPDGKPAAAAPFGP